MKRNYHLTETRMDCLLNVRRLHHHGRTGVRRSQGRLQCPADRAQSDPWVPWVPVSPALRGYIFRSVALVQDRPRPVRTPNPTVARRSQGENINIDMSRNPSSPPTRPALRPYLIPGRHKALDGTLGQWIGELVGPVTGRGLDSDFARLRFSDPIERL